MTHKRAKDQGRTELEFISGLEEKMRIAKLGKQAHEAPFILAYLWSNIKTKRTDLVPESESGGRLVTRDVFSDDERKRLLDSTMTRFLNALLKGDASFLRRLADAIEQVNELDGRAHNPRAYGILRTVALLQYCCEGHFNLPDVLHFYRQEYPHDDINQSDFAATCRRLGLKIAPGEPGRKRKTADEEM